ncbi:MAG: beta-aspartyl-peptidase [Candidatus Aminicenantaceae bacterium]
MISIIRKGNVFAPRTLGKKDIVIWGDKIGAVAEPGQIKIEGVEVQSIDASDKIVIPGFIDGHVHILGGGGEGGPATRAPEITVEDILSCGVTTVIGCLGTDGITRHMESLLAKARGLEKEGITTFIYSGSYEIPVNTITGSVRSDLVLIDKILGAGEIAISDHRSSQPTFEEIARLAAECRVGGMLGGKAGILHLHLGDGKRRLEMLFKLINVTEIPPSQVIPTHVNRNRQLLDEAIEFVLSGGYMDLTTGIATDPHDTTGVAVEEAILLCLEKQVPFNRITVSSDSNGSIPVFDEKGILMGLTIATQKDFLNTFRSLIQKKMLSIQDAASLFSTNSALFYKLDQKGEIKAGKDADLLLFDKNYNLTDCFALGKRVMAEGKLNAKSTFSPK